MMTGAVASGTLPMRRPAPLAFASATIMGLTMLAIGLATSAGLDALTPLGMAFLVGGAANSAHNVAVRTMLLREAPAGAHGKVAALYGAGTNSAAILGSITAAIFVPRDASHAYVVSGVLGVIAGLAGWLIFSARPADQGAR